MRCVYYTKQMEHFLTIDETSIDADLPLSSREGYFLREAARAVVFDSDEAVALLHVTRDHYYKLPGGGIDAGEEPLQALKRELQEEIGCKAIVAHNLGTLLEQRYYQNMTQLSHCYLARVTGEKGQPAYTKKELESGFEIVWAKNIDTAIVLLESSAQTAPDNLNVVFMRMRDVAITRRAKATLQL
jgi:8-oxo-dGTP diphosphatase